jgi:hypothetical protein
MEKRRLTIRVDDFPGTKPQEFDRHNLDSFKEFDGVMKDCGFPRYVLGVIPGYLTAKDLEFFRDNRRITLALHGLTHDESRLDEFGGLMSGHIIGKVGPVRDALEMRLGRHIVDYIPPHNALGEETAKALFYLGFENVYGGPGSIYGADVDRIHGIPYRFSQFPWEYGRSDELLERGSVEHIVEKLKSRDIYLTLHFPWEVNIGLENLRKYLGRLRECLKNANQRQ